MSKYANGKQAGCQMMFEGIQKFFCRISDARDRFWAAVWWIHWRLWLNEKRLAQALEKSGEDSMLVRTITEKHRRLMRGIRYWRTSDPLLFSVFEECENEGVPTADLQLLALNRDILIFANKVVIRGGWVPVFLAYLMMGLSVLIWLLITTLVLDSPANLMNKAQDLVLMNLIYWFVCPGLALYTTRPLAVIKRSGNRIRAVAKRVNAMHIARHSIPIRPCM